jgi:hypothetical protein
VKVHKLKGWQLVAVAVALLVAGEMFKPWALVQGMLAKAGGKQ